MNIFLIRKVRKFVKTDKIQTTKDFRKDFLKHNFKEDQTKESLIRGINIKKEDLYPNPERYVSQYYAIHKIPFKHILIGYDIYKDHITLIHTSPAGNWETNQYKKEKKLRKKRFIGLFL